MKAKRLLFLHPDPQWRFLVGALFAPPDYQSDITETHEAFFALLDAGTVYDGIFIANNRDKSPTGVDVLETLRREPAYERLHGTPIGVISGDPRVICARVENLNGISISSVEVRAQIIAALSKP